MNEEFQNYLMGILEKTGEFLGTEIPEIASQILMFNMASGIVAVSGLFIVQSLIIFGYVKLWKYSEKSSDPPFIKVMSGMVLFTFSAFIVGGIYKSSITLLKIWLAPKLFLLEYASDLIK